MRPIWSGSISFGLVNIPVRVYSATESSTLDLDLLHKSDMSPIKYAKKCKNEDVEVPNEEIVRGYEYRRGEYVILNDEDFERANVKKTRSIEIAAFVPEKEIDIVYYERPYYLEPDKNASRAYALLRDALAQSGKIGIATFVIRNREHLAALRASDSLLILDQMRFATEVRKPEGLDLPEQVAAESNEMQMATALIDQLTKPFKPEDYHDTYMEDLKQIIEEKAEGRVPVARGEEPKPTEVIDLMDVLKASLEREREKAKAS